MPGISYIIWDPKNSVHVEVLDAQHRKLFDVANHLIDVFESGSEDFLSVIDDLVNYLSEHFHQEQRILMDSKYPGFLTHIREHERFTQKVEDFLQAYTDGNQDLGLDMVVFLKDWIQNHTTKMDMLYAEYLSKIAYKPQSA